MIRRISTVRKAIVCVLLAISLANLIPFGSRSGNEPPPQLDESWQFTHPNIRVSDQDTPSEAPGIASDQFGRIFVVWQGPWGVMFSMSVDGGYTWSSSTVVNEHFSHPDSPWSQNPNVATDGRNVYVCWRDGANGNLLKMYFKKSPIERIDFSHPDTLVSDNPVSGWGSLCSMATDGRNVYITWGSDHIYFNWSPVDNISFHGDMRVDNPPVHWRPQYPDIATDGKNVYVVWQDGRNYVGTLYTDIYFDWTPVDVLDFSGPDLLVTTGVNETGCGSASVTSDGEEVYVAWDDARTHISYDFNVYMDHSPVDSLDFSSEDIMVNEAWDPMNESQQHGPDIDTSRGQIFVVWRDGRVPDRSEALIYFDWSDASNINFTRKDTLVSDRLRYYAPKRGAKITAYDDGLQTHAFVAWTDQREGNPQVYFAASPPRPLHPDLSISESDISMSTTEPVQSTKVFLNATIHSIGGMGVPNSTVTFYDGKPSLNQKIGESWISVLAHNRTYAQTEWIPTLPGNYELYVVVDSENRVRESNESNNVAKVIAIVVPHRPPTILQTALTGKDLENVTIIWSLSPDDGVGSKSVVGYKIYRNITYNAEGLGYALITSLPNGTSFFVDESAGERDPNDYFYRVCSIDLINNTTCAKEQAGKFTRPLSRGPNLISIPLVQSNASIESVLQTVRFDKAWTYNPSTEKWEWYMTLKPYKGDLRLVDHKMGVWVNVTVDSNLTVAGIVPLSTAIQLRPGWNLIGFPSFDSEYTVGDSKSEIGATRVEGFDPSDPPYFLKALTDGDILRAGFGYWVVVENETTWIMENS